MTQELKPSEEQEDPRDQGVWKCQHSSHLNGKPLSACRLCFFHLGHIFTTSLADRKNFFGSNFKVPREGISMM